MLSYQSRIQQEVYTKEDGTNYNLNTDKITDAINSPLAKDIRKTMLDGKWHPECIRCLREEKLE